jgi:hypothetical protein
MVRCLSVFLALCLAVPSLGEDELLLRFEIRGYLESPTALPEPREAVLSSVEVLVVPGRRFYGKTVVGRDTLAVSGRLKPLDNGQFQLEPVSFHRASDKGSRDARGNPRPEKTDIRTTIALEPGKAVEIGGRSSTRSSVESPPTRSKERCVVILTHRMLDKR